MRSALHLDDDTLDALWEVRYAVSRDDARPALCAVWLQEGWAVATDSYRASMRPVETWTDAPVAVTIDDLAASNGTTKVSKFPSPVPPWWSFCKQATPHAAAFNRAELIETLRGVETPQTPARQPEPIWLFSGRYVMAPPTLHLITTASRAAIRPASTLGRQWLPTLGVQKQYLLAALRASDSRWVQIAARDPYSPIILRDWDEDEARDGDEDWESGFEAVMPCFGSRDVRPPLKESSS